MPNFYAICSTPYANKGSISPTFYTQLLHAQIPKAQKDSQVISVFLQFWDLHTKKLLMNQALMKLTQHLRKSCGSKVDPKCQFHIILCTAFVLADPKCIKRY